MRRRPVATPGGRRSLPWSGAAVLALVTLLVALGACSNPGPGLGVTLLLQGLGPGVVRVDGVQRTLPFVHTAPQGSVVTLQAQPSAGHTFERWEGDLGGSQNPATLLLGSSRTVTAVFAEAPAATRTLQVQRVGGGSGTVVSQPAGIDCGAACEAVLAQGTVVTLTATPAAGSAFAGWTGCVSVAGPSCTLTMSIDRVATATFDPQAAPPANATFATRQAIVGASGTVSGSNVGAAKEPGEQNHAGVAGGASVWWTWTAPSSEATTFDVGGSDFDAVVAVYTGATIAGLQTPSGALEVSAVGDVATLAAAAGTTYQIAVDGVGGATGTVQLVWSAAPAGGPRWTTEPGTLSLLGQRGGPPPTPQGLTLRNEGSAAGGFSVSSNRAWLGAAPAQGTLAIDASANLEVTAAACTGIGTDTGSLTIAGGGHSTALTVTRTCSGAQWQAAPSTLTFVGDIAAAPPPERTVTLTNAGNATAAFTASSDRSWLVVTPAGGSVAAGGSTPLQVSTEACSAVGIESGTVAIAGGGHGIQVTVSRDCRDPAAVPPIQLSIDRVYVNQAVPGQDSAVTSADRVPLVANRAGLLRVFVTASDAGATGAVARLHYRYGSGNEATVTLTGPASVPTSTSEGTLSTTYRTTLAAGMLQPGLQVYLTVTANSGGQTVTARYPTTGFWTLDVRGVPAANFTFVPVAYGGWTPNLAGGTAAQYLDTTRRLYPLGDATIGVQVRTAYAFTGSLASGNGWIALLEQLTALRITDGSVRHYLGIVHPGYTSGIAGIAWVGGYPVAVAWSHLPSGSEVAAHELGHNWGLKHTSCGGAANPDPQYPTWGLYTGGGIGVWGYDLVAGELKSPSTFKDLMGYCSPNWISDYHYLKTMANRQSFGYAIQTLGAGPTTLLLAGGHVDADGFHLSPLVSLTGTPQPVASGPYTLIGWDANGHEAFRVPFETVALSLDGVEAFHLTVPLPSEPGFALGRVAVERDGVRILTRDAPVRPASVAPPTVARRADGGVELAWDTRAHDAVLVRDGVDGVLLGRDETGRIVVWPTGQELDLLFSDGVNTVRHVVPF